jgi:type VI secretion system protein VasD
MIVRKRSTVEAPTMTKSYRSSLAVAVCAACLGSGCGVVHALRDGTFSTSSASQAKSIPVTLVAQPSINPDSDGHPLSVVVRFYKLRDVNRFAELTYLQLQRDDRKLLEEDLVATNDVSLLPGATTRVAEIVNEGTQFLGVVAFFRAPSQDKTWKLVIPVERREESAAVTILAAGNEVKRIDASQR